MKGGKVRSWRCINFSRKVNDSDAFDFCWELARTCRTYGMVCLFLTDFRFCSPLLSCLEVKPIFNNLKCAQEFPLEPVLQPLSAQPEEVKQVLSRNYEEAAKILPFEKNEFDLLIVILHDVDLSLYGMYDLMFMVYTLIYV